MAESSTTDTLIFEALYSVDLQNTFFKASSDTDQTEMDNLRIIFGNAKRYVLNNFRGYWAQKIINLTQSPTLENGWYYAPSDLITWLSPIPARTGYDAGNRAIYQLSSQGVVYVYDREDLANIPPAVTEYIKIYFLFLLSSKQIISAEKIVRIDTMLGILGNELAKFTQETNTRGKRMYVNMRF